MRDERLLDVLKRAQSRSRHYADYWEWGIDRKLAERGVAEALIEFLGIEGGFGSGSRETPDLLFVATDGRRIGMEVAEIVDERAAAINRHAEKKRQARVWAIWNETNLVKTLRHWVSVKDEKMAHNTEDFDEVWLALATDEPTIEMAMAEAACIACKASANNLRRAFVLLGYHPDATTRFTSGCAVFPISLT